MGFVGEAFFAYAVVGGLAVFEAFAAGDVRERQQEVVAKVVVRGVGGASLADEVRDLGEQLGPEVGVVGFVGDDVDEVFGRDLRSQRKLVEVEARDDGRVFELLDGGGGVVGRHGAGGRDVRGLHDAGGRRRLRGRADGRERGTDAPAAGNGDAGLDGDVFDRNVRGIEHQTLPFEAGHLVRGALLDDGVEVGVQVGSAGGDVEVELVEVDVVAAPGERDGLAVFAGDGELYAGDGVGFAGGGVVAGNPLGCGEGDGAGLYGEIDLGVVEPAGRFA